VNLTDGGNNLRLETELVAKSSSEIAESTFSVSGDIRHFADVVEHVSTGEEQHGDETEGSPEVAVLEDGDDVGRCDGDKGDGAKDSCRDGDDLDPVDRT
jgi:hypothetical protein